MKFIFALYRPDLIKERITKGEDIYSYSLTIGI